MTNPLDEPLPVVLVVDDEPLNRDLLRRVLFRDYRVLEAGDAESALGLIGTSGPIDVVLCDQIMPGRSGTELARQLRLVSPGTVALLLTGYEDAPEVSAACRDGVVFAVLGKPWVAPRLKDAVARAAAAARAARRPP